jgi:hypothetical protein
LDVNFLTNLINENNIDIDLDDIRSNYWELNINVIIYEVIRQIAEQFIQENKDEILEILDLWEFWNLDDYMSSNDIYEIFTNYIDSHLRFNDEKIQALFEKSKYQV